MKMNKVIELGGRDYSLVTKIPFSEQDENLIWYELENESYIAKRCKRVVAYAYPLSQQPLNDAELVEVVARAIHEAQTDSRVSYDEIHQMNDTDNKFIKRHLHDLAETARHIIQALKPHLGGGWMPIDELTGQVGEQFLTSDGEMIIPSEIKDEWLGLHHHNITCHLDLMDYEPTHFKPLGDLPQQPPSEVS